MFRTPASPLAIAGAIAVVLTFAPAATAQNLLTNGSFENGTFTDNGNGAESLNVGSTAMTGWTVTSQSLAWLKTPNSYGVTSANGSFFLDLTGYNDNGIFAGVTQTIATTVGQSYVLSFELGADQSASVYSGPMGLRATAGGASQTFTFTPAAGSTGNQWATFALPFVASGTSTTITLLGTQSGGGQYLGLDNVSLQAVSTAAPEPSSLALVGALLPGLMGAAAARARRRRA